VPAPGEVNVPVLSSTRVSTALIRSTTCALRRNAFSRARQRCAVPSVSGAANASAHGQATMSTDVNAFIARLASANNQNAADTNAMPMTPNVNRRL